jgi:hypothetical protein
VSVCARAAIGREKTAKIGHFGHEWTLNNFGQWQRVTGNGLIDYVSNRI